MILGKNWLKSTYSIIFFIGSIHTCLSQESPSLFFQTPQQKKYQKKLDSNIALMYTIILKDLKEMRGRSDDTETQAHPFPIHKQNLSSLPASHEFANSGIQILSGNLVQQTKLLGDIDHPCRKRNAGLQEDWEFQRPIITVPLEVGKRYGFDKFLKEKEQE